MQTAATYTKIQRTPKMERAIKRAKHVRVEIVDFEARQFRVHSTTRPGVTYLVDLTIAPNGDRLGQCECVGFRYSGECTHRVAAVGFYRGVLRSRQEAEKLAATGGAETADEAGAAHPLAPAEMPEPTGLPTDADITGPAPNVETYCAHCGDETGGMRCDVDRSADLLTLNELIEQQRDREAKRDLFRRLLNERLNDDDSEFRESTDAVRGSARPAARGWSGFLSDQETPTLRDEMDAAVLIKPMVSETKFGSVSI